MILNTKNPEIVFEYYRKKGYQRAHSRINFPQLTPQKDIKYNYHTKQSQPSGSLINLPSYTVLSSLLKNLFPNQVLVLQVHTNSIPIPVYIVSLWTTVLKRLQTLPGNLQQQIQVQSFSLYLEPTETQSVIQPHFIQGWSRASIKNWNFCDTSLSFCQVTGLEKFIQCLKSLEHHPVEGLCHSCPN